MSRTYRIDWKDFEEFVEHLIQEKITELDLSLNHILNPIDFGDTPGRVHFVESIDDKYDEPYSLLKKFPDIITEIKTLESLSCQGLGFKFIPYSIGNLNNLISLKLSDNHLIEQGFFCKFGQEHPQKKINQNPSTGSGQAFKTQIHSSGQPFFTDLVQDR
jgi:Leucine-rich repeat (LRR) protein